VVNILIVDDEPMIREWFQMTVDRIGGDYVVAGEATNAAEALDFCRKHSVDLVVTDVKMPDMNGIELLERLKEEHAELRVIIFSSYNEFQFAAEALKLGASEYILKAEVTHQGLNDIFEKIKKDIALAQGKMIEMNSLRSLLNQNEMALRNVYFRDLLKGNPQASQQFSSKMELFRTPLSEKNMTLLALGLIRSSEEGAKLRIEEAGLLELAVTNIINETLLNETGSGCSLLIKDDVYLLLVNTANSGMKSQRESLLLVASRVAENIRKFIGADTAIGISTTYSKLSFITEQVSEAMEALDRHLFYGNRNIAYFQSVDAGIFGKQSDNDRDIYDKRDSFSSLLDAGRFDTARLELDLLMDMTAEGRTLNAKQVKAIVLELVYQVINKARGFEVPAEKLDAVYSEAHTEVQGLATYVQLRSWATKTIHQVFAWIEQFRIKYGDAVQKACDYISSHYQEEIQLQQIAGHVHLSRTYFSELFKKETGMNFNEYLMHIRIEKAKSILKGSPIKISDLSVQVGYASTSYFIKVFRKHVGMSPYEYMESNHGFRIH
jgi:two-component system response regulator YesN